MNPFHVVVSLCLSIVGEHMNNCCAAVCNQAGKSIVVVVVVFHFGNAVGERAMTDTALKYKLLLDSSYNDVTLCP